MEDAVGRVDSRTSTERSHTSRWVRLFMSVTQVVRDSTVVEHAKVAAQQKRRMFIIQLEVNAYDEPNGKLRPGLTRILEGIEEAGWHLDLITPSESGEGTAARLFIFRPDANRHKEEEDAKAAEQRSAQDRSGQQQAYSQQPTGPQPQDPYAGYQHQGYHQGYQQPYPGYDQQHYPGYGQQHGYGQQYPGYGQQGW